MADQSALLMTYTTLHIGAYLTLGAAAIAVIKQQNTPVSCWLFLPFACFVLAGAAGGVIASNLPDYDSFAKFANADLSFWGIYPCHRFFHLCHYTHWARVEHILFW